MHEVQIILSGRFPYEKYYIYSLIVCGISVYGIWDCVNRLCKTCYSIKNCEHQHIGSGFKWFEKWSSLTHFSKEVYRGSISIKILTFDSSEWIIIESSFLWTTHTKRLVSVLEEISQKIFKVNFSQPQLWSVAKGSNSYWA